MIVYVIYHYYKFHLGELSMTIEMNEGNLRIIMKRLLECVFHMHRWVFVRIRLIGCWVRGCK